MRKKIIATGLLGLLASLIMFAGDMFLYFTPQPIHNFEQELMGVLGSISSNRLMVGGLLGPLAAFLYCLGFYQIYLATKPAYKTIAGIIWGLLSFGIVYGGAFHAHFAHLGFVSAFGDKALIDLAETYTIWHFYIMFFPSLVAYLMLAYLIISQKTNYPRWFVLFSPIVLFWLAEPVRSLPQPFMIVVAGGWSNLIFVLFFSISTLILLKKLKDQSYA